VFVFKTGDPKTFEGILCD